MEKKLSVILALVLCFSLASCGENSAGDSSPAKETEETTTDVLPEGQTIQYYNYQITLPYSFELEVEDDSSIIYADNTNGDDKRSLLIGYIPNYPVSDFDDTSKDKEDLVSTFGVGEQVSTMKWTTGLNSNMIIGADFEGEHSFNSIYIVDADGDFYVFNFISNSDEIYKFAAEYIKTLYYSPIANDEIE